MLFVSDFADQAVMLPLATVVVAALALMGWWRGAAAWLLAVGGTLTMMLIVKVGLVGLSEDYGSEYMISPSGHVASACVVYGGMAMLLFRDRVPTFLLAVVPISAAVIVGYSRVALMAHSVDEVVAGAIVGCIGLVVLTVVAGPRPRLTTWPLMVTSACTVLALHGLHLPAEEAIRMAASNW